MANVLLIALFLSLTTSSGLAVDKNIFPDGFSFGASTAAYQVEGAWNESDRGECIWDRYIHDDPSKISNKDNADVACDSFHKYKEDIALAASLKLNHYRFSISWSRLLPTGFNDEVSMVGVLYYQNVLAELEKYGITPLVTLYHWDLPQSLQDLGGWTNPKIVDYFTDYAEVVFKYFPSVKLWITINEPKQVCLHGYGYGTKAPGLKESGISDYLCAYHVAKTHAAVYHLYQNKFKALGGRLSMAMDGAWTIPATQNESDTNAAERRKLFEFGLYAHPIFHGDWPDVVQKRVDYRTKMENFTFPRLPVFTAEEKAYINNTADFMALNYYNIHIIADAEEASYDLYSYDNDAKLTTQVDSSWSFDLHRNAYVPTGLRDYLKWVKETYNDPEVIITENGLADDGSLADSNRTKFLNDYLHEVLASIHEDGVNITGYTFWSLLDNFEWNSGYAHHFGLYQVDFNDPNRTRTPKKSAEFYRRIIEDHGFLDDSDTGVSHVASPLLVILAIVLFAYY